MKKLNVLIVVSVIIIYWGCKDKEEIVELQKQNQDLAVQLAESDSVSAVYLSTIKEVEAVIDSILPGDNAMDPSPVGEKIRTRLSLKVDEIDGLLLEKDRRYNALNYRLNNSNNTISEMSAEIEELNSAIREKERVNSDLAQTVKQLEKQVTEQSAQIESHIEETQKLNEALETKTNTLNSVWFIAGSEDELQNRAVIEKTGGFLGLLGRVNRLNPQLDRDLLQMMDVREKTTLTLNTEMKNIEFITYHHPESYKLHASGIGTTMLTISDPAEFWRNSKYLVIAY